jgi:8-oxo-dGTP diphosphatase
MIEGMSARVSAHVLFVDPTARVLLRLRDERADLPYPGQWDLVGGAVEFRETIREAAVREVMEEIGLDVVGLEYFGEYPENGVHNNAFVASLDVPLDQLALTEGQRLTYASEAEALSLDLVPWVARLLRDFFGHSVAAQRVAAR